MARGRLMFPLIGCLCALLISQSLLGARQGGVREREEEETGPRQVSMVARNSTELRAYFRQGRGRAFEDYVGDPLMNRMLDDQIDDFVRRLMAKNLQLEIAAWEYSREDDGSRQGRWLKKIRETAGELEGTLRVWTDRLRPQQRSKGSKGIEAPASTASREELLAQLGLYQQQIRHFLFPEAVAVSVSELRSEGFHGTLRRIQRLARALE